MYDFNQENQNFSLSKLTVKKERPCTARAWHTRDWSSEEGHKADALALGAEEGRDKLRKAAGRSKYPSIRRSPNEGTRSG